MRLRIASALTAFLLLVMAVPVGADDPAIELERVREQISALTAQINSARAESRRVGEELAAAQARLTAVQEELAAAQARVDEVRVRIAGEEARLADLNGQLETIQGQLVETSRRVRETLDDLELQAVEMYMDASSATAAVLLNFDSASDLTVGLAYAGDVTGSSEDLLDTFEFLRREEDRQRVAVEERRTEVRGVLAELAIERADLETEATRVEALRVEAASDLVEVQSFLGRLRNEIAQAEQHKDGLEEDAARLQRDIERLQSRGGTRPGALGWPVPGGVSSSFGYRIHPIFGTKKIHTGIDLSASSGTPISAAGAGTVILAGPYGGYGNAVVIDHGGGLATLYAHQSKLAVSTGARVSRGDTIGSVGCTGYCTGPHLHFETRENGTPVDPMKYLGG